MIDDKISPHRIFHADRLPTHWTLGASLAPRLSYESEHIEKHMKWNYMHVNNNSNFGIYWLEIDLVQFNQPYSTRTKHTCIVIACILNRPYDVIFCITSMSEITYYIQFHLIFKETVAQIPRISDHNKLRMKPHAKTFSNKTMILGGMAQTQ